MSSTNVLHYKQCREKIHVSFQLSFQSFEIIKVHWLNVTGLVSGFPASSKLSENLKVISSCSSTSRFNGAFSLPMESESDTASLVSKAFENSILVEVSGRWYFCYLTRTDLTSLYPVRCITNLSGIPFFNARVAVVARRLWLVNWPSIPATLQSLFTVSPRMSWPHWRISIPNC